MAIKINVSPKDQKAINDILERAGYPRQKRKYHCTVGFIEKMIPEEESILFGEKITCVLQAHIQPFHLIYEVQEVVHLFGQVIAFLPTPNSLAFLKDINMWLGGKVKEISEGQWKLNKETASQNYTPHMTLWRAHHPDQQLERLQLLTMAQPFYHLSKAAYVLFKK